jgi:hypothetical protein
MLVAVLLEWVRRERMGIRQKGMARIFFAERLQLWRFRSAMVPRKMPEAVMVMRMMAWR